MEDLIECKGTGCKLIDSCRRYNPKPKKDYLAHSPYDHKHGTCILIWNDNADWLYNELQRIEKPTN